MDRKTFASSRNKQLNQVLFRSRTASFRGKKGLEHFYWFAAFKTRFLTLLKCLHPTQMHKGRKKIVLKKKAFEIKSLLWSGAPRTRTCGLDMWLVVAFLHICTLTAPYKKYRESLVSFWNRRSYYHTPFIPWSASCAWVRTSRGFEPLSPALCFYLLHNYL